MILDVTSGFMVMPQLTVLRAVEAFVVLVA
jgi:hypothetical protein